MSWESATTGAAPAGYIIEAAAAGSSSFVTAGQSVLPRFAIAGAPAGTWQLRVRALTAGGSRAPSEAVMVMTGACNVPPDRPSGLAALVTDSLVTLGWQPPATGDPLGYVVEAASSAAPTNFARLPMTSVTATFETGAPTGVYVARVRARNGCGESAASNETIVRVPVRRSRLGRRIAGGWLQPLRSWRCRHMPGCRG